MEGKIVISFCVLCVFLLFGESKGAAIPMWEYLSKEEKMSYLYSMFANQVDEFCNSANMKNCNQELLKYGLKKLKLMPEDHLDSMDPYQRGASNIIWDSMMEGHEMMKTTPKPTSSTTAKPNSYEDESFGDDFDFGTQSAASAKIDNVYRVPPPTNFIIEMKSGTPLYTYPHNVVPYLSTVNKINNNDKLFNNYNKLQQIYNNKPASEYQVAPLTGPMVVKVYPDGSPVGEPEEIPQDEDLRQYQLSKVALPNF